MAYRHDTTRRAFLKVVPAATAGIYAAPAAALAAQEPVSNTPELPFWWDKLTGPTAESDEEVFMPWQDTEANRALAVQMEELRDLLLTIGETAGVDTIQMLELRWANGIPKYVNIVGRSGVWGEGLHHYRPEFGWIDRSASASFRTKRTRIVSLYHEIKAIDEEARGYETGLSGQADDDMIDYLFYNRRDALADEMMALPCTCAADFAAKAIIDTVDGAVFSDWESGGLWVEARELVG
ncbi:hypothetical protein SAMN05421853_11773 [Roseivivax halotolerans]|uniref:Gluconate 2-dehydrogenase subunit 3 n=1 Tax=Roseivivax halotolerans TaxID=93684 RepID=A0A1I6AD41_9RHOB|nr:hypothetical protein [Roseivivax halotolerans]SFQ66589.1 hypothetical protein SAMN05421853_11773 [Roseivivax halotolerans]